MQGQDGPGLNETGHQQAKALSNKLDAETALNAIYTSDLTRAAETAAYIGKRMNLEPKHDVRLRERHFGTWQGKSRDEVADEYTAYRAQWDAAPLDTTPTRR